MNPDVTDKVIKAFHDVYNTPGYGFLKKVYENAMIIELRKRGCQTEAQKNMKGHQEGKEIGDYYADLFVDNSVLVELKTAENICKEHEYQLINYLKATESEVGLLLNFGKKAEFKRKVFSNR